MINKKQGRLSMLHKPGNLVTGGGNYPTPARAQTTQGELIKSTWQSQTRMDGQNREGRHGDVTAVGGSKDEARGPG